jgi:hypothetical protein
MEIVGGPPSVHRVLDVISIKIRTCANVTAISLWIKSCTQRFRRTADTPRPHLIHLTYPRGSMTTTHYILLSTDGDRKTIRGLENDLSVRWHPWNPTWCSLIINQTITTVAILMKMLLCAASYQLSGTPV